MSQQERSGGPGDPAEFARLLDLIDPGGSSVPQTAEEKEFVRQSRERVKENERRLRRELPPSTGEIEHLRMGQVTQEIDLEEGDEVALPRFIHDLPMGSPLGALEEH